MILYGQSGTAFLVPGQESQCHCDWYIARGHLTHTPHLEGNAELDGGATDCSLRSNQVSSN